MLPRLLMGICCSLSAIGVAQVNELQADDRWFARFTNGDVIHAAELGDWSEPGSRPSLAGRDLFDEQNPVRLLLDQQSPVERPQPEMFVELFGGDRLVGEVLQHRNGNPDLYEHWPAHLLVRTTASLQRPEDPYSESLKVATRWLRRIVWQATTHDRYVPGTVWLRDGGQIEYRSLRWGDGELFLLTANGLRRIAFAEIAELHFPIQDEWQVYLEQLAILTPRVSSRLLQIELADGSRLTTSQERFVPRHWGDRKRTDAWLQLLQPAWSLDPLWVRFLNITSWTWFDADQPPLSWATPQRVERDHVFGSSWQWQRDRSTLGDRLQIGMSPFVRGFGVHATTDLWFSLPPFAKQIRTQAGLDRRAAAGGSVKLSVDDASGATLYQSDPLHGSQVVIDSGWLSLPATDQTSTAVMFRADMLREARSNGTDPFDIRDIVDWVDPQIRLDRDLLTAAVTGAYSSSLPGWSGWSRPDGAPIALMLRNHLDESDSRNPQYRLVAALTQPYLLLSRSMPVTESDRWFSLVLSRFEASSQPTLVQIKIDGRSAGEFEVPIRYGPIDPDPLMVPIPSGPRRSVQVDVVIYSGGAESFLDCRGVTVTAERPGVHIVYDDDARRLQDAVVGPALTTTSEAPYSGRESLHVAAGSVELPQIEGLNAALVDLPKLGQFRFLTFAWKGSETPGLIFRLAHDGRLGADIATGVGLGTQQRWRRIEDRGLRHAFSYDIGTINQESPAPVRLDKKVPAEWKLEARDVVGDFGPLLLTGLAFECRDPGQANFDAIALARTPQDLDWLKKHWTAGAATAIDPQKERQVHGRPDCNQAISEFAPAFATPEARHGLTYKPEHQGQAGSWQTHPNDRDQPFVLRTVVALPADHPQELDLLVSHLPQHDWLLQVRVNGETIREEIINNALTVAQRGFASLQVDLTSYQGQTVLLEVLNASNDWSQEYAYWKRVNLRDR
ncbi:hypothetical protein GC163_02840 [bacterium]|nr:hypothetical protein [bacterium]